MATEGALRLRDNVNRVTADMKRMQSDAGRAVHFTERAAICSWLLIAAGCPFFVALDANAQARSKWDDQLLKAEIHDVRIKPSGMWAAWVEITGTYMVRANLVLAGPANSVSNLFAFEKQRATGKDLLDAYVGVYSDYTYTQDPGTGVIWTHPRTLRYADVLSQNIMVVRPGRQVAFESAILLPVYQLLSSSISMPATSGPTGQQFGFGVDLQPGVYPVRDIINACCIANPVLLFQMGPARDRPGGYVLTPRISRYSNPLASPRDMAVHFWETEIAKSSSTNGIPTIREMAVAMSDPEFRVRWAARAFLEATFLTYRWGDLIRACDSPEQAVWVALGIEAATYRGVNDDQFFFATSELKQAGFADLLSRVKDPNVALLACLELAREKAETGYLDAMVSSHRYSEAEIAPILPDIWRMTHESQLVVEKLRRLKLNVPQFSPENLRDLDAPILLAAPQTGKSGP
jgi:hypothetical protein